MITALLIINMKMNSKSNAIDDLCKTELLYYTGQLSS